jgi:hypothetical protein
MGHRSETNQLGYESTSVPGEQSRRDVAQMFGRERCRTRLPAGMVPPNGSKYHS